MKPIQQSLTGLAIVVSLASFPVQAGDLYLGRDASASNPLVSSTEFAEAVAQRVYRQVLTLEFGDRVVMKTFGDGRAAHVKGNSLQITRQMPQRRAASLVAAAIREFPNTTKGEAATNLLGYLENNTFDCTSEGAAVWILSDAIEQSVEVSGLELLKGKPLPAPFATPLAGCEVVMIGVGRLASSGTLPRSQLQALKTAWTDWFMQAGASSVTIHVNP